MSCYKLQHCASDLNSEVILHYVCDVVRKHNLRQPTMFMRDVLHIAA